METWIPLDKRKRTAKSIKTFQVFFKGRQIQDIVPACSHLSARQRVRDWMNSIYFEPLELKDFTAEYRD